MAITLSDDVATAVVQHLQASATVVRLLLGSADEPARAAQAEVVTQARIDQAVKEALAARDAQPAPEAAEPAAPAALDLPQEAASLPRKGSRNGAARGHAAGPVA